MILVINCGSSKTPQFETMLSELGYQSSIVQLEECEQHMSEDVSGLIISGAPILLTEVDHQLYLDELSSVRNLNIPVLGVCFGHQMIGLLYGANVMRCPEDRDWQSIEVLHSSGVFNGMEGIERFAEDHCECISLPEGFTLTATSSTCEVEGMENSEKQLYGVQFHPEVSGEAGKKLLDNFCKLCIK